MMVPSYQRKRKRAVAGQTPTLNTPIHLVSYLSRVPQELVKAFAKLRFLQWYSRIKNNS